MHIHSFAWTNTHHCMHTAEVTTAQVPLLLLRILPPQQHFISYTFEKKSKDRATLRRSVILLGKQAMSKSPSLQPIFFFFFLIRKTSTEAFCWAAPCYNVRWKREKKAQLFRCLANKAHCETWLIPQPLHSSLKELLISLHLHKS